MTREYKFLVMKLCSINLYTYFKQFNKSINIIKILKYAKDMLENIQFLHKFNIIHRDIKPENFVFQLEKNLQQNNNNHQQNQSYINLQFKQKLLLIDLGLCKKITKKGQHIKSKQNSQKFIGTIRYASINAHESRILTKRDDIESYLYTIIYLMKKQLPWQKLHLNNKNINQDKKIQTQKIKKSTSIQQLCSNLPKGIENMMYYVRGLMFNQVPDYNFLFNCLQQSIQEIESQQNQEKQIFTQIDQELNNLKNLRLKLQQKQNQQQDKLKNSKQHSKSPQKTSISSKKFKFKPKKKSFIVKQNDQEQYQQSSDNQSINDKFMI